MELISEYFFFIYSFVCVFILCPLFFPYKGGRTRALRYACKTDQDDFALWITSYHLISWRKPQWWRGVVVITTEQLHSTKPGLRFCTCSNPARSVSEIQDGEDL